MSIRVSAETHRRLRLLYVETGESMNKMINEAIEQWLDRREEKSS